MKTISPPSRLALALTAALAFGTTSSVFAGTIWDGGGTSNTNINLNTNWDGLSGGVVNALDGTTGATFGTGGSTATINVDASFTGITINRNGNFAIADGAGSLTVGTDGITVTLPTVNARIHTISESSLILGGNQTWSVTNNGTRVAELIVSSIISDGGNAYGITKTGSGVLSLSTAANTFSGGIAVEAGTLNIRSGGSANNSTVFLGAAANSGSTVKVGVINGATNPSSPLEVVAQTSGAATTRILGTNSSTSGQWSGPITMNGDLTVDTASAGSFTLQTGATVNLGANTLTLRSTSSGSVIAKSVISGTGGIVVNNTSTGNATLEGISTYTGATTVEAGKLLIASGGSLANTASITVFGSATLENANGGVINRNLTLHEGAALTTSSAGSSFTPASSITVVGDLSDGFSGIALTADAGSGLVKNNATLFLNLSNVMVGSYGLSAGAGFSGSFGASFYNGMQMSSTGTGYTLTSGGFNIEFENATNLLNISAIPEPSSFALLTSGLTAAIVSLRRRRRAV